MHRILCTCVDCQCSTISIWAWSNVHLLWRSVECTCDGRVGDLYSSRARGELLYLVLDSRKVLTGDPAPCDVLLQEGELPVEATAPFGVELIVLSSLTRDKVDDVLDGDSHQERCMSIDECSARRQSMSRAGSDTQSPEDIAALRAIRNGDVIDMIHWLEHIQRYTTPLHLAVFRLFGRGGRSDMGRIGRVGRGRDHWLSECVGTDPVRRIPACAPEAIFPYEQRRECRSIHG